MFFVTLFKSKAMMENIDYVYAENARTIDPEEITNKVVGLFLGTRNNFYFFKDLNKRLISRFDDNERPDNEIMQTEYLVDGGTKLSDFILSKLREFGNIREFEKFIAAEILPQNRDAINLVSMDDVSEFKVQASWLGSGVVVRERGKSYEGVNKYSGTPFALKLGKKKGAVKKFYKDAIKLVS